jgi:hypothetical protein
VLSASESCSHHSLRVINDFVSAIVLCFRHAGSYASDDESRQIFSYVKWLLNLCVLTVFSSIGPMSNG